MASVEARNHNTATSTAALRGVRRTSSVFDVQTDEPVAHAEPPPAHDTPAPAMVESTPLSKSEVGDVRPGSPVPHRRHRRRLSNCDAETVWQSVEGDMENHGASAVAGSSCGSGAGAVRAVSPVVGKSEWNGQEVAAQSAQREVVSETTHETILTDEESSPGLVTLLGAPRDLRRKRIKRVSHYVLGPLLGEGAYGVVRDGIDVSGEGGGFGRCAIKIVAMPRRGASGGPRAQPFNGAESATRGVDEVTGGLRPRLSREERHAAIFRNELRNLQRFHCRHLIRAEDVFSRYGKEYVVMPIAVCTLRQLVEQTKRWTRRPRQTPVAGPERHALGVAAGAPQPRRRTVLDNAEEMGSTTSSTRTIDSYTHGPVATGRSTDSSSLLLEVVSSPPSLARARNADADTSEHDARLLRPLRATPCGSPHDPDHGVPVLAPTLIKGLMYQLLAGVAYLHKQNIAHNDIKPANVLLFESGTVVLSDLGSVGTHYDDQGTPLFTAPELCTHYYGATEAQAAVVDARVADMWCCGLVLYYLITGRIGPLPVHRLHDESHPTPRSGPAWTRFQLYRRIAHEATTPGLLHDELARVATRGGLHDLLCGLLEPDPTRRLTAAAALSHPWLALSFKTIPRHSTTTALTMSTAACAPIHGGGEAAGGRCRARTSAQNAMEDAIERDVARRVLQSAEFKMMLHEDRLHHLQFVADCCNILNIPLPPEIIRAPTAEPYGPEDCHVNPTLAPSQREGRTRAENQGVVVGTVVSHYTPRHLPSGCVDPELFLPHEEEDYYESKGGKAEFDVRCLRALPRKVRQMEEYLHNVVMVQCGYRTGPDPAYAVRVDAVTGVGEGRGGAEFFGPLHPSQRAMLCGVTTTTNEVESRRVMAPATPPVVAATRDSAALVRHDNPHTSSTGTRGSGSRRSFWSSKPKSSSHSTRGSGTQVNEDDTPHSMAFKESSKCLCGLM